MKKIIEVKHLFKLYRVGDSIVRALNGVDFSIYGGILCDCQDIRFGKVNTFKYAGGA